MALQTKVHLLKGVPLLKNNHVLSFKGTNPYTYMTTKIFKSYSELTYIKDNQVELPVHLSEVENQTNYLMYTNDGSFWYYAFIDRIEYVGEGNTRITFSIDHWTTYNKVISVKGFVEREHANYNEVNTIPEEVGLGDYIVDDVKPLDVNNGVGYKLALVITTAKLENPTGFNGGTGITLDGTQQPYNYYLYNAGGKAIYVKEGETSWILPNLDTFNKIFSTSQAHANKIAMIKVMEEIPFGCTVTTQSSPERMTIDITGKGFMEKVTGIGDPTNEVIRLSLYSGFNQSFVYPKRNTYTGDAAKLNYHPFSYYELVTGSNKMEIKKEHIVGNDITIVTKSTLDTDPTKSYLVNAYKGSTDTTNTVLEPISVNIPVITENIAAFMQSQTNTLTERTVSGVGLSLATMAVGGAMMATGVGAGLGATILGSGAAGLGSVVGSLPGDIIANYQNIKKQNEMPNDVSGSLGKLIQFTIKKKAYLLHKTQTAEYVSLITNYFKRFGWKVMKDKSPNLTTRTHFNFVKMKDCIIIGDIPQSSKASLVNLFNEGVTLWHTQNIGDYTPSNLIG